MSWIGKQVEDRQEEYTPASVEEKEEELELTSSESSADKGKVKVIQTSLDLEPAGKGRFKGVEPTFYAGEDLDYPTFMRRGIKLGPSE